MPVGYWGPITSSLLWCESKYEWSRYVAEPMNSATNIVFIALALFGARNCRNEALPFRYTLTYLGIAFVGLGSLAFHATLLYEAQLLDELPMIYTSLVLSYCVLEHSKKGQRPTGGIWLPVGLFAVAVLITVGYLAMPNPILHQVAYAAIQVASTVRVLYLLYASSSPLAQSKQAREKRATIRRSYHFGAAVFLTGFLIWNLDNAFCDYLRLARAYVGYPWAALLEGHAWWHILTGYGAYHLVASAALLGSTLAEGPDAFDFRAQGSHRAFWLPEVVRVRNSSHDDAQKGRAKSQ
ncbi:unnamed protein product [Parajaminaea phylloscopi]